MKSLILTLILSVPTLSLAKVEAPYEGLRKAKIQCTAVQGQEVYNGQIKGQLTAAAQMITFDQDGGADYTDAKCFLADGVDPRGEKYSIGSCFSLDRESVIQFSASRVVMKQKTLNAVIEINFATGNGRYTSSFSGCDWGRKCFSKSSEMQLQNCKAL